MAGNTIDEIFAALINEGEEVKTAGEEVKPEEEAKVEGEKKPEAEKVAALAEILPEEALNVLREYVKEAEEEEKKAEQVKEAEEAIATGRFMARGFVAELQKLGADYGEPMEVADFSDKAVIQGAADVPTPATSNIVQDGSTALTQAKKEDAQKSPVSPTARQDVVKAVKKIISAADVASKGQDPQEVPNNLGVKETATSGNKSSQPNNVA